MRSIVDITFGRPEQVPSGGITVPMLMTVTDDASDDDDVPVTANMIMHLTFDDQVLNSGDNEIRAVALTSLERYRTNFGPFGFGKLRDTVLAYIDKKDLTVWARPYIPHPESETRH